MKTFREVLIERGLDPDPKPRRAASRFLAADRIIPGVPDRDAPKSFAGNPRLRYWPNKAQHDLLLIASVPCPGLMYVEKFCELNHLKAC